MSLWGPYAYPSRLLYFLHFPPILNPYTSIYATWQKHIHRSSRALPPSISKRCIYLRPVHAQHIVTMRLQPKRRLRHLLHRPKDRMSNSECRALTTHRYTAMSRLPRPRGVISPVLHLLLQRSSLRFHRDLLPATTRTLRNLVFPLVNHQRSPLVGLPSKA